MKGGKDGTFWRAHFEMSNRLFAIAAANFCLAPGFHQSRLQRGVSIFGQPLHLNLFVFDTYSNQRSERHCLIYRSFFLFSKRRLKQKPGQVPLKSCHTIQMIDASKFFSLQAITFWQVLCSLSALSTLNCCMSNPNRFDKVVKTSFGFQFSRVRH